MDKNTSETNGDSVYYEGIDFLKGILIILVIIGHNKTGSLIDGFLVFTIYSFHMPLLVGISGFLLNQQSIENTNFSNLFKKYFYRLLLPWLIAWIVYYIIWGKEISIETMVILFFFPLYHLWFVPAIFIFIIFTWFLKKFKTQNQIILIISITISLSWYFIYLSGHFDLSSYKLLYTYLKRVNRLRPYYLCFYVFGLYLRNVYIDLKYFKYVCALVISIFVIRRIFFYKGTTITLDGYILNFALILFSVLLVRKIKFEKYKIINWIGKNSLPIYLWHMAFLIRTHIERGLGVSLFVASMINYCLMIGVIFLIFLLSKVDFINKYVFGNTSEDTKSDLSLNSHENGFQES